FGAAGNAMNDIWDAAADRVNRHPIERPLAAGRLARGTADLCVVGGALLGLGAAALVGGAAVLVGLGALAVLLAYSPLLKRRGLLPHCAVRPARRLARREPAHRRQAGAEHAAAQRSHGGGHRGARGGEDRLTFDGVPAGELAARWGVPQCELFRQLPSTLDAIHQLGIQGAPVGTTVIAEEQTAGRGRDGRTWHSPPGGVWLGVL